MLSNRMNNAIKSDSSKSNNQKTVMETVNDFINKNLNPSNNIKINNQKINNQKTVMDTVNDFINKNLNPSNNIKINNQNNVKDTVNDFINKNLNKSNQQNSMMDTVNNFINKNLNQSNNSKNQPTYSIMDTNNKSNNKSKNIINEMNKKSIVAEQLMPNSFLQVGPVSESIKQTVNKVNNVANKAINNIKNTSMESLHDLTKPIAESYNAMTSNIHNDTDISNVLHISILIGLGILLVILIIFVMFRDSIVNGFEFLWKRIKYSFEAPLPKIDSPIETVDSKAIYQMMSSKKEVLNISHNEYTYSDAEPLCKAFGAELATYDQVKEAWNKGADWCNYGWVKGQAAVYPTSEETYNKLQSGPEEERKACGVTGVNGGYFDNPELKFGVNCFGSKPSENDKDIRNTFKQKNETPGMLEYDKKIEDYKHELSEIPLNGFNHTNWSN